jgi:phosphatidylglycerophosphate synthase
MSAVKRNILTLSNGITIARIASLPAIYVLAASGEEGAALALALAAALSDYLDGYLARRRNEVTALGMALDPLADRLLVATLVLTLVNIRATSVSVALAFLGREVLALIGYMALRARGIDLRVSREGKIVAGIVYGVLVGSLAIPQLRLFLVVAVLLYYGTLVQYAVRARAAQRS